MMTFSKYIIAIAEELLNLFEEHFVNHLALSIGCSLEEGKYAGLVQINLKETNIMETGESCDDLKISAGLTQEPVFFRP